MFIQTILKEATQVLETLDAELLLAHVLHVSRTYLYTWPEQELTAQQQTDFNQLVERRCAGEPMAYILGRQEFWSLPLEVTRNTLIPRPETELLVECVLNQFISQSLITIADLGTGSGAIALALAHEHPEWRILATDQSSKTLEVAERNAKRLKLSVQFFQGDWCGALPSGMKFDAIVSNPPYIAIDDPALEASGYEPESALIAAEKGLKDLKQIIVEARSYLKPGGCLFLEHGYQQAKAVASLFLEAGYQDIRLYQDNAGHARVSMAISPD